MIRSSQLAERLGITKNKVLALATRGDIPAIKLPSGHYRFDLDKVLAALCANRSDNDD